MKRRVLVIPKDELQRHFKKNTRQDVKVIAPSILTEELYIFLLKKGKILKKEERLTSIQWKHSEAEQPNKLCESNEFIDYSLPQYAHGPFSISFANEKASQDKHYHKRHLEVYYSEYPMRAKFKYIRDSEYNKIELENGGAIIFAPEVIHLMELKGLTIVLEIPAVENDRYEVKDN